MSQSMRVIACLCSVAAVSLTAAPPPRPRITGVAHIALYSAEIAKSRAYYLDLLGFREAFSLTSANGSLAMTFIKVNDRQYIELFPEAAPATDRLNHISVEVDDAEAMRAYLASKGVAVPEKVATGRIGNSNFTIKDPDGHSLEFVQYQPGGWTLRDKGKALDGPRISTRITHVGILVGALEPAMRFYRDLLGFQEIWRGSRDGKRLDWVNMRVPDGTDYIEFMLYDQIPAATARGTQHHLCLEVHDIEKSLADLKSRPERRSYARPLEIRTGINRRRQLNLFDPDGTRCELMEAATVDGRPAPSSTAPPR